MGESASLQKAGGVSSKAINYITANCWIAVLHWLDGIPAFTSYFKNKNC